MYIETKTHKLRIYPAAIVMTSLFGSVVSPVHANEAPKPQTFVVTAYYSALPDQCCYYRGGYEEELVFNGQGIKGADNTPVYPGMIAAPPSYPFGTVIELPSLGVIGTVHDRGGRIVEWNDDAHRIDLWMGYGEEGLARALTWGVRSVEGFVHTSNKPAEKFDLASFPAERSMLAATVTQPQSELIHPVEEGYTTHNVRRLQETLSELGYFSVKPNAHFGPATKAALHAFLHEYGFEGDGSALTEEVSAALIAAKTIGPNNMPILSESAHGQSGDHVRGAQKMLRFLGYYRGRTHGEFDDNLKSAVLAFQLDRQIIPSKESAGAGRVGPSTRENILHAWKEKVVKQKAEILLQKHAVQEEVLEDALPSSLLANGDKGVEVTKLQTFLVDRGYLPASDVTGYFGNRTENALKAYQIDQEVISGASQKGAGVFGPMTKRTITEHIADVAWERVRAGL